MGVWRSAGALAAGLVLGASAMAVAGDTPTVYTGCLTKDGTLYKVAVAATPLKACAKGETLVSWNQQGPQGVPGTNGIDGSAGTNGTDGAPGAPGALMETMSVANGQSVWTDFPGFGVGVGCTDDAPVLSLEASGGRGYLSRYREDSAGISFESVASDERIVLGPSAPKGSFVIWDPTKSGPPVTFTLRATDCTNMVYSESPVVAGVLSPGVVVTMPVRMSRLVVSAAGGGLDAYDADISYNRAIVPIPSGDAVHVEFWAMDAVSYSCNGGPAQTSEWETPFYYHGTCDFTVTGRDSVSLTPSW